MREEVPALEPEKVPALSNPAMPITAYKEATMGSWLPITYSQAGTRTQYPSAYKEVSTHCGYFCLFRTCLAPLSPTIQQFRYISIQLHPVFTNATHR